MKTLMSVVMAVAVLMSMAVQAGATAADLQMRLAKSEAFLAKVESQIVVYAIVVKGENTGTANHAARAAYADQVLANSAGHAVAWAVMLAGSANVAGTITAHDDGRVTSSVSDAALFSQIAAYWNLKAVAG